MDHVVAKLSEIEAAAVSIITNTEVEKKKYEESVKEVQRRFDAKLSEMTTNTIEGIKSDAETTLNHTLETMRSDNELTLESFQTEYNQYHESYAAQIIKNITEV